MATLKEYFDTDFTHVLTLTNTFRFEGPADAGEVVGRVHLDFNSNTKYISAYIPATENPSGVAAGLLRSLDKVLAIADGAEVHSHFLGEAPMKSTDLAFAGRVFIYSEGEIELDRLLALTSQTKPNGIHLQYRGSTYAQERSALEKPLAFISHDSRDKDAIARPVAVGLTRLMCPVWFDEFTLTVGDRLRESIERGIRECKKCVLILSPHFLSNPGWTKAEFNSIFTRELIEGSDFLLPVWYGVGPREIFDYSPTLVDRLGVNWDLGEAEVVRRLYRAITATPGA